MSKKQAKPETKILTKFTCLRCEQYWFSGTLTPLRCGKCKTPYWNTPPRVDEATKEGVTA